MDKTYEKLALNWQPWGGGWGRGERFFYCLVVVVLTVTLVLGFIVSIIEVPPAQKKRSIVIPDRVAKFIMAQEKPIKKPKPPAKPLPKPKPRIKKARENVKTEKPLTKTQQQARKKAENSGLLALGNELADLIDTSAINTMVGKQASNLSSVGKKAATHNYDVLNKSAGEGSGGVDSVHYGTGTNQTTLSNREIASVRQSLLAGNKLSKSKDRPGGENKRADSSSEQLRGEEEVTLVFDQNKGSLYSVYNRARRKNPGLRGKIILEITIAPNGTITAIRVVSNELNDAALEKSLIARIKRFNFGAKNVKTVTVTYPIEFLPT